MRINFEDLPASHSNGRGYGSFDGKAYYDKGGDLEELWIEGSALGCPDLIIKWGDLFVSSDRAAKPGADDFCLGIWRALSRSLERSHADELWEFRRRRGVA